MKNHPTKTIMGLKKTLKRFEAWALNKRTSLENVSEEQSTEFHESESSSDEELFNRQSSGQGQSQRLSHSKFLSTKRIRARVYSTRFPKPVMRMSQPSKRRDITQSNPIISLNNEQNQSPLSAESDIPGNTTELESTPSTSTFASRSFPWRLFEIPR